MDPKMTSILRLFCILLPGLLLLPLAGQTQEEFHIRVVEEFSGMALEGATLRNSDSSRIWTTDKEGLAVIGLPLPEDMRLIISYVGYETHYLSAPYLRRGEKGNAFTVRLMPMTGELRGIVVSARRYAGSGLQRANAAILDSADIAMSSFGNIDNTLSLLPGVFVNRSNGIFSKNTSVSLRGTASAHRTLILVDGIPINKLSGTALNWHMIDPGQVGRIEVLKGPGSSLYGNNAMGGVINIRMQEAQPGQLTLNLERSSYNTTGASASVSHAFGNGIVVSARGRYRHGDGYINVAPENRDSIHVPLSLAEGMAGLRVRSAGKKFTWDIEYIYYNDHRGLGRQVHEADGEFLALQEHQVNARFIWASGPWKTRLNAFQHAEIARGQSENLNSTGAYKLVDEYTVIQNRGVWMQADRRYGRHAILAGAEIRQGSMDETVIYRTSTDKLHYGGNVLVSGIYAEDLWDLLPYLNFRAGVRVDISHFNKGFFQVEEPSSSTGFIEDVWSDYGSESQAAFSPLISATFHRERLSFTVSASQGFLPPRLDDLYKSGKISKGFKLANPKLEPEQMRQYAADLEITLHPKHTLSVSAYHSQGFGFHYLVATGDSIDMGADGVRPVLQRRNVPGIQISGLELSMRWDIHPWITLNGGLTRQHSIISEYPETPDPEDNLKGNFIAEVPDWMGSLGLSVHAGHFSGRIDYLYTGEQFSDDQNLSQVEPYSLLNTSAYYSFKHGIGAALEVWNLLNKPFTDRKGNYSPGRFITFRLSYKLKMY